MRIQEVIARTKAYCRGTDALGRPIDQTTTRDVVLWGDPDQECTGVVTCIWASVDVIREAASRGANLIISHEALFWNHGDHTDWLRAQGNAAFLAKAALLDEHGICVWRCHDYVHSGIPSPVGDGTWVDGIFFALAERLGWKTLSPITPLDDRAVLMTADIKAMPVPSLAKDIRSRLSINGVRVIGATHAMVRRVGLAMHMTGLHDNDMISCMEAEDIDCLLAMETTDYTVLQYVCDSSQAGRPRCVLSCGHFNLEEPGMELMARWLPGVLGPSSPPVSHVCAGDHFLYQSC